MLVLALMAGRAAAAVAPGTEMPSELKTVAAVRFEGLHRVSAKEVRAVLKTTRPSLLPWSKRPTLRLDFLRSDTLAIENVYQQHGYLDARAHYRLEPAKEPDADVVTFTIEEGRLSRIASVELVDVRAIPRRQLERRLFARVGRPFNPLFLVADTTRISEAYRERGYVPHTVAAATRSGTGVHVRYEVHEGPQYRFGQLYFSAPGDQHVNERLVRREILMKPGEVYRASRVQRSVERLYETGLFSQIQMSPLVDSTNTLIEFDLRVRERRPRWLDAGIGSGTAERLRFTGEWGHRNLLGRGIQGSVSSKVALDARARFLLARVDLTAVEPWLLRSRTRGVANPYYENRHDRTDTLLVDSEAKGVSFQLRREYGRYTRLAITQDNSFVHQDVTFLVAGLDAATRGRLAGPAVPSYTTHTLQLALDRDSRDDPFNPSRGSLQNVTGEVAGGPLQGTSSFAKAQMGLSRYVLLGNDWVFAWRIRAGSIDPLGHEAGISPGEDAEVTKVPLNDRFRIGGVNSVRGYDENEIPTLGGLAVLQANLEVRIPVVGPFGVECYLDAGNVWARPGYLQGGNLAPKINHVPMTPNDMRYVAGAGARMNLPFGPLRVDFTWGARPDETGFRPKGRAQFAIGPSF